MAIKAFTIDLTGGQAVALADRLGSLLAVNLTHPSIVAPIDAGLESELPYLVGEYVFGESLDVALRRYGPAPAADAARLLTQVADALDVASAVGVLHGSLHPRDVLVTPDLVRLTGLGVVASLEGAGVRAPARPPYSAPERNAGGSWDERADVFSLASIAAELLTGRPVGQQAGSPALDVEGVLVARPEELAEVLLRGLAPGPRDRYATAGELATALELALTGRSSRPAHAERIPRVPAAARVAGAVRRRRAKPRHEAVVLSEPELQLASEVPLQPAPAGIVEDSVAATEMAAARPLEEEARQIDGPLRPGDSGASPADAELRPSDAGQGSPAQGEIPPIDITPRMVGVPQPEDAFSLTATGPEQPVTERDLVRLQAIEALPVAAAPIVSVDDLPLEDRFRSGAAELVVERAGSLPFEEREPPAPATEQSVGLSGRSAGDEEGGKPGRRPSVLSVAIAAVAVLTLGLYGGYRMVTRRTTPPQSATISVPSTPARAPAPADIYLPARPGPAATGTSGPSVRQTPAAKKTTKATTAPKATSSSTSTARRSAATIAPGSLSVESRPSGARVFLDGRPSGTTPLVLSKVTAGSHDVRVERAGYRRWSSRIKITSGRRSRLTASLEPESSR